MTGSLSNYYKTTTPEQREARFSRAMRLTTLVPLPTTRDIQPISDPVRGSNDPRPFATSREPCRICATRGDLGCKHQRPFSAHPASPIKGTRK